MNESSITDNLKRTFSCSSSFDLAELEGADVAILKTIDDRPNVKVGDTVMIPVTWASDKPLGKIWLTRIA